VSEVKTHSPMYRQILATPAALSGSYGAMESVARSILSTPEIFRVRRIVLCGSGDSFFAAKAVEWSTARLTGIDVASLPSLEAARYRSTLGREQDLRSTLVVAISSSGEAARTVEAANRFRRRGALVLAMTAAPESRLARAASRVFSLPVPQLPAAPGYGPYLFSMVALHLLAFRLAEVRGSMTMDKAQLWRQELQVRLDELPRVHAAVDAVCADLATRYRHLPVFEFLGSGPAAAVAQFGMAKMLEAVGTHALAQDVEEWAHLHFFTNSPHDTATVLLSPLGSGAESRAKELLTYLERLERPTIVVADEQLAAAAAALGFDVIPVTTKIGEMLSPVHFSAPMAFLASHLADLTGAEYGRGCRGPWESAAGGAAVRDSLILGE
jgi:glutamine---fructose-6-phosphate transaminase (isomerizing)